MDLNGIDLNLLAALDVLVAERNVTAAGRRMGLSQPAMSSVLSRLRDLLDDPVLVRTSQGMMPTPRVLEIVGTVRAALGELESAVKQGAGFEPSTARHRFRVAATDIGAVTLWPRLSALLRREAPLVDLEWVTWAGDPTFRSLQDGQVDVAISVGDLRSVSSGLYKRDLFDDRFVCLVRDDHPVVGDTLSLDTYCDLLHVLVSPRGGVTGLVDPLLSRIGRNRRVATVVPTFLAAPFVVAESDMIVTLSEWVARPFAKLLPLRMLPPPLEVPAGRWYALWHQRTHLDAPHRWFREALVRAVHDVKVDAVAG